VEVDNQAIDLALGEQRDGRLDIVSEVLRDLRKRLGHHPGKRSMVFDEQHPHPDHAVTVCNERTSGS
jgi:hypothetical protein